MHTLRGALRAALLFVASSGCASTTPPAPTTPTATATPTAITPPSATPDAAAPPPEPSCPSGSAGAVRSYVCGDPRADEAPGALPAPYARCPEARGGMRFSAAQTAQRRGQVEQSQTCCYLERCQTPISY